MIEDVLGRIRGAKNWPETLATVTSLDRILPQGRSAGRTTLAFCYTPPDGEIQSGEFLVDDGCSLYNMEEKDTFPLRYNPSHPERYWSSEYTIPFWRKFYSILICAFAAVFLYSLFSVGTRH